MKKGIVVGIVAILLVSMIPMAFAEVNNLLIGQSEVSEYGDNLITGSYHYSDNDAVSTADKTSPLGILHSPEDNEKSWELQVPDENTADAAPDYVKLKFNEPAIDTVIEQGIIEYYAEIVAVEDYDNLTMKVKYDGGVGSMTIYDDQSLDGNEFYHLEELTTDYAYEIQDTAGENAQPIVILKTPSGDNQTLAGEILDPVKSWGYEDSSTISASHQTVWQISMVAMGIVSFILALIATRFVDIETP